MKVYVGQAKLVGPISRYAGKFNLLELGAEPGRCPRPAVLKQWRQDVPKGFVFAVRLARVVGAFEPGAEEALAFGLRAAEALDARWIVLQTPATLGPGQRNRERLKRLFERLLESGRHVAWDPRGVWDEAEILPLISEVDVQWARDASRYEMVEEPLAYVRIPALGTASRVGLGLAEKAGENLRGFEEAYVVIEGEGAGRAARIIRELASLPAEDDDGVAAVDGVEELSMDSARKDLAFERSGESDDDAEDFEEELDDGEDFDEGSDEDTDDEDDEDDFDDEELDEGEDADDALEHEPRGGRDEIETLDDDEGEPQEEEDPEMTKPTVIDDSDLPWAKGKKGNRT